MYAYRNKNQQNKNTTGTTQVKSRSSAVVKSIQLWSTPLFACAITGLSVFFLVNEASSASSSANLANGTRVFTDGLNIELDRSSPAYAALEDTWMESTEPSMSAGEAADFAAEKNAQTETLESGAPSEIVADRILNENRREQNLAIHEKASREAQAQAIAVAATKAFKSMADRFQKSHFDLPAAAEAKAELKPDAKSAPAKQVADIPLPRKGSGQKLAAIDHPTQTISLADLHINRDELVAGLLMPLAQAGANRELPPSGRPFVIARHGAPPQIFGNNGKPAGFRDARNDEARINMRQQSLSDTQSSSEPDRSATEVAVDRVQKVGSNYHQVFISGPLEFTGGLALSNAQDHLVIFRERDGEVLEAGNVWLREGKYEIFVEDTDGLLLAELRTTYGDILGRGSFDLSNLPTQQPNVRRIDPVSLKIQPVPQGVVGTVLARRSNAGNIFAAKSQLVKGVSIAFKDLPLSADTRLTGRFDQPNLLEGSSVVVRANRMGYWGTMAFAKAGSETEVDLFPDQAGQMMHHLVATSRSADKNLSAIIWGRVTKGGAPVTGATVDLMTSSENVKPVYFNSAMLPDINLQVTSSNGLYAFYPVAPGAQAIQAHIGEVTTEASIFPTEERTVSRIDLETSTDHSAKLKIFDAFRTDYPLSAKISDPSNTHQLMIGRSGELKLRYSGGSSPLVIDVDAGNGYKYTRLTTDRERRAIFVPMIQSTWLEQLKDHMKVNMVPDTGTIVGFVQGQQPYRAVLQGETQSIKHEDQFQVIYFDARGEATGKDFGEPGGGFVFTNVKQGFRTVTIQPSGTTKVFASVMMVEARVTNVLSHWIR